MSRERLDSLMVGVELAACHCKQKHPQSVEWVQQTSPQALACFGSCRGCASLNRLDDPLLLRKLCCIISRLTLSKRTSQTLLSLALPNYLLYCFLSLETTLRWLLDETPKTARRDTETVVTGTCLAQYRIMANMYDTACPVSHAPSHNVSHFSTVPDTQQLILTATYLCDAETDHVPA